MESFDLVGPKLEPTLADGLEFFRAAACTHDAGGAVSGGTENEMGYLMDHGVSEDLIDAGVEGVGLG